MPAVEPIYMSDARKMRVIDSLGDDERMRRAANIDALWRWYEGDHPRPLVIEAGKRDDNVIVNLCQRAVDRAVEFIGVPRRLTLPGGAEIQTGAGGVPRERLTAAQRRLDALFAGQRALISEVVLAGKIEGHVFVKIHETADGDMTLSMLDGRSVTVYWDGAKGVRSGALWYRIQWTSGDISYRQDIVPGALVDGSAGWVLLDYVQAKQRGAYQLQHRAAWAYPFAPVVEIRNRRRPYQYYGVGDLGASEVALNQGVNFVASNTARILKFHAHPRTVGVGVDAGTIQETSIDGFFSVPDGAQVFNLEMGSDLQSSMNFYNTLKGEFFASLRVLDLSVVKDRLGNITNFGVRMMFAEMLEMATAARSAYGEGLAEAFRRLLIVDGYEAVGTPVVTWDDPLPSNRLELLQAAELEAGLGLASRQSLAQDVGRDFAEEQARIREEDEAEVRADGRADGQA